MIVMVILMRLCLSPLMSYDSVTSDLNRLAKCKNFTMFNKDLAANKLPQWMFTPNMSTCLFLSPLSPCGLINGRYLYQGLTRNSQRRP